MQNLTSTSASANHLLSAINNQAMQKKVFVQFPSSQLKYGKLLATVKKIAGLFRNKGLIQGNKIVIFSGNEQYTIELFLAALCCGICPVIISVDSKKARVQHIYDHLDADFLFIDGKLQHYFSFEKSKAIILQKITLNPLKRLNANNVSYPALLNQTQSGVCPSELPSDGHAYIIFTSGSTDNPKGVIHSYQSMYAHLQTLCSVFSYDSNSTLYNNIALEHADGIIHGPILAAYAGAKIVRDPPFSLQNINEQLHALYRHKATHILTLPTVLAWIDKFVVEHDCVAYPEFKYLISTAGPLNSDLWARLNNKLDTFICNIYGLTETVCGAIFAGPNSASARIGSIGKAIDIDACICTNNNELQETGEGELLLSGPSVFAGYFNNSQATDKAFVKHQKNWFKTGDIVRIDAAGYIQIIGRKKSVIVSGGRNIHPDEVNEILLKHPLIIDCYTFACNDEMHAEVVACALVVNGELLVADVVTFCLTYLETYKVPKNIYFLNALPKGPSGKVVDAKLKAMITPKAVIAQKKITPLINDGSIINVAAKVFKINASHLSMDDTTKTISLWDSLGHLNFILALEDEFQVKFNLQEMINITTLSEARRLVAVKLQ